MAEIDESIIKPPCRVMANVIVTGGRKHCNSIAAYDADAHSVCVTPFERETHSTLFFSGTIYVEADADCGGLKVSRQPIEARR